MHRQDNAPDSQRTVFVIRALDNDPGRVPVLVTRSTCPATCCSLSWVLSRS